MDVLNDWKNPKQNKYKMIWIILYFGMETLPSGIKIRFKNYKKIFKPAITPIKNVLLSCYKLALFCWELFINQRYEVLMGVDFIGIYLIQNQSSFLAIFV